MLRPFELHRPHTIEEACDMLTHLGDDAVPYAGGTELLLLMKEGLLRPRHLVDLKRIPGLDTIAAADGRLTIGAVATHRSVERSATVRARCPVLASVARHVANVRVRNVGTVGGNLAFADPHSDLATLFLALDASVELVSPRGRRTLTLDRFVRGAWDTDRAPDELLTAVTVTPWAGQVAAAYVKFGVYERPTLGIAVSLLVEPDARRRLRIGDARIAIGCVNPHPARARAAEVRLLGGELADLEGLAGEAAALAAEGADPADDLHGSADYKREMVAVFTRRALRAAAARALGAEPDARYTHAVVA
jgi:aerobic carbon-monoxide dehydrogenase medium subunit